MPAERRPTIWVVAGPNGGGKTTIVGEMIRQSGADWFDPDDVTRTGPTRWRSHRAVYICVSRMARARSCMAARLSHHTVISGRPRSQFSRETIR